MLQREGAEERRRVTRPGDLLGRGSWPEISKVWWWYGKRGKGNVLSDLVCLFPGRPTISAPLGSRAPSSTELPFIFFHFILSLVIFFPLLSLITGLGTLSSGHNQAFIQVSHVGKFKENKKPNSRMTGKSINYVRSIRAPAGPSNIVLIQSLQLLSSPLVLIDRRHCT